MRYMLLICGSEAQAALMTQEECMALMQAHAAFASEMQKRGLLTGGAPLQPTTTAKTVRIRHGQTLITDGPFAETKEQLAGSYVLNCKDMDEAIEMARDCVLQEVRDSELLSLITHPFQTVSL